MILCKLARRYISKGRTRTISSFGGIVLATFLVTTVMLMSYSIYNSMNKSNQKLYGDWHIAFTGENVEERTLFINEFENEFKGKKKLLGFSKVENMDSNISICLFGADANWYEIMNINLISGSLPKEKGEVIVSEKFYENYLECNKYSDSGVIEIFNRIDETGKVLTELVGSSEDEIWQHSENINYKVVGIYDDINRNITDSWYYSFYTYSELNDDSSSIYVRMNNPKQVYQIGESISTESCIYNRELLSSLGISMSVENSRNQLVIIVLLALIVVIISTIFLIGNSFMTSFSERVKQIGLLMSLGMKKNQIFIMTILECVIISIIGIPIGMLLSIIFTYGIVHVYGNYLADMIYATIDFKVHITISVLIIIFIASFLVILLSALYPALVARRIEIVKAIKQTNIESTEFKIKKMTNTNLSIEDIIVDRNMKKYKKKFFVARISLIISVLLLLVSKITCYYAENMLEKNIYGYDIVVTAYDKTIQEYDVYNKYILNESFMLEAWWVMETSEENIVVDSDILSIEAKEYLLENDSQYIPKKILVLDDTTFGKISSDLSQIFYYDTLYVGIIDNGEYVEKKYTWFIEDSNTELEVYNKNKFIVEPLDAEYVSIIEQHNVSYSGISVIMSQKQATKLIKDDELAYSAYIKANNHALVAENIENHTDCYVMDIAKDYETQKSNLVTMELLSKGFAGFIWLFSCINTLFTIITNVTTRRKEFTILISLGISDRGIRTIFMKEGFKNLAYVSLISYILSALVSIFMSMSNGYSKLYFPIQTALASLLINIVLYFVAYFMSYIIIRDVSVADELKCE